MVECFIGLGGNIGNTFAIMSQTVLAIANMEGIHSLKSSRLFLTSPVSDIPQPDFLNAVCRFYTTLGPVELFLKLEEIEFKMGKRPKQKEAPRTIDIDLLFYGTMNYQSDVLQIPHPVWYKRLFVLAPLAEMIEAHFYQDVKGIFEQLKCTSRDRVEPFTRQLPYSHQTEVNYEKN